jgi:hypothetical protein
MRTLSGYDEPHLRRCGVVLLWNVSSLSYSDPDAFLRGSQHYHMESRIARTVPACAPKETRMSPGRQLSVCSQEQGFFCLF